MEVSSLASTSKAIRYSSPTESLLLKKVNLPLRPQSLEFRFRNRRTTSVVYKENNVTVQKILCFQKKELPVVEAKCMNDVYDELAARLVPNAAVASNPHYKYIVGLVGPPGAGKSTVAHEVANRVNKMWPQKASSFECRDKFPEVATVLPMDGFHLYRHQLDAMENPKEAHARRGAPWTFNPELLLSRLMTLKSQGSVYVPSFDHGAGDPVEDDILVAQEHKVVIVEGNYLFMDNGVWKEISSLFDEKWFIELDINTSMRRVLKRHISTGKPPDVAKWRIEYNDRLNAELILKSKENADLLIRSIDL